MDKFTLDRCSVCGEHKALMNNVCIDCKNKTDLPDFMKEIFRGFKDEKNNSETN
jgi:hypothetical protein